MAQGHRVRKPRIIEDTLFLDREVTRSRHLDIRFEIGIGHEEIARVGSTDQGISFCLRPDDLHRLAVRQQGMMSGTQNFAKTHLEAGSMGPLVMTQADVNLGFVERAPVGHAVGKPVDDERGIIGKPVGTVAIQPAAATIKLVRKIPVKQGQPRRDIFFE